MIKSVLLLVLLSSTLGNADEPVQLHLPAIIQAAEVKYELPVGLLNAVIAVESAGNHKAINKNDGNEKSKKQGVIIASYGLMQLQLAAVHMIQRMRAKEDSRILRKRDLITPKQLLNPETNVEYGAAYLKWLLVNHAGNVALALTCFNAGPNSRLCRSKRYLGDYVGKILNAMVE